MPTISTEQDQIIFTQLSSLFNETNLFIDNQYDFRPKHCTVYAALELVDNIINHMDKNEVLIHIFLDLSKAFDTIDHNLLHKLRFMDWMVRLYLYLKVILAIDDSMLKLMKCSQKPFQ